MNQNPSKPTISVVIPVFNGESYISETINSVLGQTYPAVEIIVLDDGSTDRSAEIVRQISGPIPISYYHQQNQGPGVSRNLGVSVARGDWIAFLDADDIWYPHKLALQVSCAESYPEAYLFYSAMDFIDEAGETRPPLPKDILAPLLFREGFPSYPSTIFVKKDIFLKVGGFNPSLRYGEDWDLFARVIGQFQVHYISQPLVRYRCHMHQANQNLFIQTNGFPIFHKVLKELWRYDTKKQNILGQESAKASAAVLQQILDTGDYGKAKQFYDSMRDLWQDNPSIQILVANKSVRNCGKVVKRLLTLGDYMNARKCCRFIFTLQPWAWKNLWRWALSYVPGVRGLYRYRITSQ